MACEEVEPIQMKSHQLVTLSSLPEELLENILARISRWNYPLLSLVSKKFYSLLSSSHIYQTRSLIGTTETVVYVCVSFPEDPCKKYWCCLSQKPQRTLKENPENVLVPIPIPIPIPYDSTVVAGSDIYLFRGPLKPYVRIFDCRTHTWRDATDLRVGRVSMYAVYLDEKIYLMGRTNYESPREIEVFDIKTQSWKDFPIHDDDLRNDIQRSCKFNAFQGKLYFMTCSYTYPYKKKEYTYEPKEGKCELVGIRDSKYYCDISYWCVVDDIMYGCTDYGYCVWYDSDSEGRKWKVIKGLEELHEHISTSNFINAYVYGLVKYGENLLVIWKPGDQREDNILYAEISLERRCIDEVWGKVEWVDTLRIFPHHRRFRLWNCVSVSV